MPLLDGGRKLEQFLARSLGDSLEASHYWQMYLDGHCHPKEGKMNMKTAPGAKCIYAGCNGVVQRTEVFPVEGTQIAGQEYLCTCGARWVNWLSPTSTKLLIRREYKGLMGFRNLGRPLKTDEALTQAELTDRIEALEKELDQLRRRG